MRIQLFVTYLFLHLAISVSSTPAQSAQIGIVIKDGAMVYQKGNFDASVIGYLPRGKKVKLSNKTYGPFYRIRFKQGVVGFISDIDVVPAKKVKELKNQAREKGSKKKRTSRRGRKRPKKNFLNSFFVGLVGSYVQFKEVISQEEYSDSLIAFGPKVTFPLGFLEGPFVIDGTVLFYSGAPAYYKQVSQTTPTGMVIIGDFSILYKVSELARGSAALYLGAGPMITYSRFLIEQSNSKNDLEEIRLGAVGTLGISYQLGKMALRLEPRVYLEKATYFGANLGVVYGF